MVDRYIWGKTLTHQRRSARSPSSKFSRAARRSAARPMSCAISPVWALAPQHLGAVGQDPGGGLICRAVRRGWYRHPWHRDHPLSARPRASHASSVVASKCCGWMTRSPAPSPSRPRLRSAHDSKRSLPKIRPDAVIIEDYCKGCVSQELAGHVVAIANSAGIAVALDPHPGNRLWVRDLVLLKPNCAEAYAMANLPAEAPLEAVVQTLLERWQAKNLLITLGRRGMALAQEDGHACIHRHCARGKCSMSPGLEIPRSLRLWLASPRVPRRCRLRTSQTKPVAWSSPHVGNGTDHALRTPQCPCRQLARRMFLAAGSAASAAAASGGERLPFFRNADYHVRELPSPTRSPVRLLGLSRV